MENRARQHHRDRLGETIREEIAALIEGELGDPRIGLATVSEVQMAPDGRSAHVLVSVVGDEKEGIRTLAGLRDAVGYIRHELADRLRLRQAPELIFRLDKSEEYESRVDQLLRRIEKRKK